VVHRGNFSTEPLPSNDEGIFTEPLSSNDREIFTDFISLHLFFQNKESRLKNSVGL
jgi:hypothetical protein